LTPRCFGVTGAVDGLVPAEGGGVVGWPVRECGGEGVRARDGEAGAVAEQRHTGAGIAGQRDAALRPRGQVDQADGVEVEVVSGPELLK
jgi:hypothetical protein